MAILARRQSTKALPELPQPIEGHPDWIEFAERLERLQSAAEDTRERTRQLETQRATLTASLTEAEVLAALTEDPDAPAKALTIRTSIAQLDRDLEEARRLLGPQAEAVRRFAGRGQGIRAVIAAEQTKAVAAVHRSLTEDLVRALEVAAPIHAKLKELQKRYPAATAALPFLDGFRPVVADSGLANHTAVWVRRVQAMGIKCDL